MKIVYQLSFFILFVFASCFSQVTDGPYLIYQNGRDTVYQIWNGEISKKALPENRMNTTIQIQTDVVGKTFGIKLKPGLSYELSTYEMPKKLVAISDIEGNFEALRKLLQATRVIDKELKWLFGDGHLVLTGDFFDRGDMVTEVLWLIYKLESEAMEAGGNVHFILGNHETMNLYGDLRYVNSKYEKSKKLLKIELNNFYSKNTEIGQWLRTKDIIKKIGDNIFVHAGIPQEVIELNLQPDEINNAIRDYIDKDPRYLTEKIAKKLIGFQGLNWYRGYFQKGPLTRNDSKEVNDALKLFDVNHIIVGHTVVDDTISTHYNGKVINIDTKHSEGKSEALLIEEGSFYRVNMKGERFPLFKNEGGP